MIPKNYRIGRKKDIDRLRLEKKLYAKIGSFVVKEVNNLENTNCRFLISVSKKYSKKAVDRNKLKRRLFSLLYKNKNKFKDYCDYHFICVQKSIVSNDLLKRDILKLP